MITSKYNTQEIQRQVDIRMNYENDKRIYEKNEKAIINTPNEGHQEIYHSYKRVDRANPKHYLLVQTIVEINDNIDSDNQNMGCVCDMASDWHESSDGYVRHSLEKKIKYVEFDVNGRLIKTTETVETVKPIELIDKSDNGSMKLETISTKIPVKIERNQIIITKRIDPIIEVKTESKEKVVLDVHSWTHSSTSALSVTSETSLMSTFMANNKPQITSDTLISNVEFSETKVYLTNENSFI